MTMLSAARRAQVVTSCRLLPPLEPDTIGQEDNSFSDQRGLNPGQRAAERIARLPLDRRQRVDADAGPPAKLTALKKGLRPAGTVGQAAP